MGQLRAQVDVVRAPLDRSEVVAEALPGPVDPLVEHGAGDVLDPFHQGDEAGVRIGSHRCEADAAVAHDRRGHPVPARRRHAVVPRGLPVVVRVDVDEPRGDQQAVGVDLLRATARDRPDGGNGPAVHRHVGGARFTAPPVGHQPAPDHEVVHSLRHALPLTLPGEPGRQSVGQTVGPDGRSRPRDVGLYPVSVSVPSAARSPVRPMPSSTHSRASVSASDTLPQARLPSAVRHARMPRSGAPSRSKVTV